MTDYAQPQQPQQPQQPAQQPQQGQPPQGPPAPQMQYSQPPQDQYQQYQPIPVQPQQSQQAPPAQPSAGYAENYPPQQPPAQQPQYQQPAPAQPAPQQPPANNLPALQSSRGMVAPDFAKGAETGLENTSQYVSPPRVKVIQALTKPPLSEIFNAGDVVAVPQNVIVAQMPYENNRAAERGQPFTFTPLFFFAEWCTWNPRNSQQAIADRSFDQNGEIARKSRSASLRIEAVSGPTPEHPQGIKVRHCEHLCFVISLHQGPLAGLPVLLSFMRGEHRAGSNFLNLARMRNAPLYASNYEAIVSTRRNNEGEWFGLDVQNPESIQPWVTAEQFERNKAVYEEMKRAHESQLIRVDYEEDDSRTVEGAVHVSDAPAEF